MTDVAENLRLSYEFYQEAILGICKSMRDRFGQTVDKFLTKFLRTLHFSKIQAIQGALKHLNEIANDIPLTDYISPLEIIDIFIAQYSYEEYDRDIFKNNNRCYEFDAYKYLLCKYSNIIKPLIVKDILTRLGETNKLHLYNLEINSQYTPDEAIDLINIDKEKYENLDYSIEFYNKSLNLVYSQLIEGFGEEIIPYVTVIKRCNLYNQLSLINFLTKKINSTTGEPNNLGYKYDISRIINFPDIIDLYFGKPICKHLEQDCLKIFSRIMTKKFGDKVSKYIWMLYLTQSRLLQIISLDIYSDLKYKYGLLVDLDLAATKVNVAEPEVIIRNLNH